MADAEIYYRGLALYQSGQPPEPPLEIDIPDLKVGEQKYLTWYEEEEKWHGYAGAVELSDEVVGTIIVARRADVLETEWLYLLVAFAIAGGFIIVWAYLLARYISGRITDPIMDVISGAEKIMQGDYDVQIEAIDSDSDIATLAQSFTAMAQALQRVDERDKRFFMSITHELKTPLTTIRGHAQMIRDRKMDPEEIRLSLEAISKASEGLERLIGDIIDLARLRGGRFALHPENVPVHMLLQGIVEDWTDNRVIIAEIEEASVQTDGGRLEQVVSNILTNAGRYAKESIKITGKWSEKYYTVSIQNDGPVIPPEQADALFEAFWSDQKGGSMGLGLTISRELMRRQSGDIVYEPKQGQTCFVIKLPR
jgi:signal transduction histidine kinase